MVKVNLEQMTEDFVAFLPGAFERVIGGTLKDLRCHFNEKEKKGHYDANNITYEFKFQQNKYGQIELEITGTSDNKKEKIILKGKPKNSQGQVKRSRYIGDREMIENGSKIIKIGRASCRERV